MHHRPHRRAFTILELSLVLSVVALLIGSVVAGKSMMRAAELRSVMTDAQTYLTAIANFRNQYKYLPGDMPNATKYWGAADPTPATCVTLASDDTTCDGNADGMVNRSTNEPFRVWQHLRSAGMISQKFTGINSGAGSNDSTPGVNVPAARIPNTGFAYVNYTSAGNTVITAANYGNTLMFGTRYAGFEPLTAAITAVDAFSMDTKMDDGKPATGQWMANGTGGSSWGSATACTTSSGNTDLTGGYNVTATAAISCSFYIMSGL
ncbi:MAG: type II secretion system protein [Pseudomonadota bacterium]